MVEVVKPDRTQFLATAATPASAGDALVIYGAGLGEVSPAIAAGSAAPGSTLATTVNNTTAMIGGQPAQVLFSGLAPGFAGLYQVNVLVPPGIAPGANVPLTLTVGGIFSLAGYRGDPIVTAPDALARLACGVDHLSALKHVKRLELAVQQLARVLQPQPSRDHRRVNAPEIRGVNQIVAGV